MVFTVNRKRSVIFDCTATYQGTFLNSELLQGPDLSNTLLGVLLRFGQEKVAIMAHIESMFHQVRICPDHLDYLCFLWLPDGSTLKAGRIQDESPSLWSHFVANCALQRIAN